MEAMLVGIGVLGSLGGLITAYRCGRSRFEARMREAPRLRRIAADRDGISLELEGGRQPAHIDSILVRSGSGLRSVRVKRAEVRNWYGVQIFADFGRSRLRLRNFELSGKHGLPEGFVRVRLEQPPSSIRVILIGRLGREGELGAFALQSKVVVDARSTLPTRPRLRLLGTGMHSSLRALGRTAIGGSRARSRA